MPLYSGDHDRDILHSFCCIHNASFVTSCFIATGMYFMLLYGYLQSIGNMSPENFLCLSCLLAIFFILANFPSR